MKSTILLLALLLALCQCSTDIKKTNNWTPIVKGLEYRYHEVLNKKNMKYDFELLLLRIDLSKLHIRLLRADDHGSKNLTTKTFARLTKALACVNASFFTKTNKILGLEIQSGKMISKLRNVDWGVFFIKDKRPYIVHTEEFVFSKEIDVAIQTGPRLVVPYRELDLDDKNLAKRTFVSIDNNGKVVFGIVSKGIVSIKDLSRIIKQPVEDGGLGYRYALNLDGGSSSQCYIKHNSLEISLNNFEKIPNALGIFVN